MPCNRDQFSLLCTLRCNSVSQFYLQKYIVGIVQISLCCGCRCRRCTRCNSNEHSRLTEHNPYTLRMKSFVVLAAAVHIPLWYARCVCIAFAIANAAQLFAAYIVCICFALTRVCFAYRKEDLLWTKTSSNQMDLTVGDYSIQRLHLKGISHNLYDCAVFWSTLVGMGTKLALCQQLVVQMSEFWQIWLKHLLFSILLHEQQLHMFLKSNNPTDV